VRLVVLDASQLPVQPPSEQAGFELTVVATMVEDRLPRPAAEIIKMPQARSGVTRQGPWQPRRTPGQASQDQARLVVPGQKRVGDRVDLFGVETLEGEGGLEAAMREAPLLLLPSQPLLRQGEGQDTIAQNGDGALLVERRNAEKDQDAPPAARPERRLIRSGCGDSLNRNTVSPAR
jgi:hypothetical protein